MYSLFVNCVEVSPTEGTTRCIVDKIVFHTNNVNMYMWYKTVYYKLYLTTLTLLLHLTSKLFKEQPHIHHSDVIMGTMASQITSLTIVYWTLYSVADQRKHQSSASLAFERGIHRGPVNSPHKWPVTRKIVSILWRHQTITWYAKSFETSIYLKSCLSHTMFI